MPFKKILLYLVFIGLLNSCTEKFCPMIDLEIIPTPNLYLGSPEDFILDKSVGLIYDEDFQVSANFLKNYIESGSKIKFNGESKRNIRFERDETISNIEGYEIRVLEDEIKISAATDQGAFYAVQSLRQLLPPEFENGTFKADKVAIKGVVIEDEPQFKYRGMHLDVGRHMYSVEFIKKYIDALAMLKMNTFHWHLTEDQGWRIEIKKYPKLQEVAAYRNETLIGHYSDQPHQFDGKRYGGFYTQDEVKDIVAYAKDRFVTVIPEIELPGHSQAALAAYPELGCTGEQIEVAKKWGVFEDIYCPKEETFSFLEDVLDEVLELFPSEYIHIGGDEAPKTRWKNCKHCQALITKEGLKDEHELQSYFISRMERYLNSKGRQIIGWDEILEGGLAPNATVMSWRGINGAVEAAKQHHNVIMTPTSHCYFDYYQSENSDEPLAIGGFLPLEKVYSFNPIPEELSKEEAQYVLGAQGNIWTEYMPTEDQVEYMMFPRILAMSEVVWSNQDQKSYPDFVNRVETFHERFEALDINYANHLYEIEGELKATDHGVAYQLKSLSQGKTIRYTEDGSEPSITSKVYEKSIPISESIIIKAAVFNSERKLGTTFTQEINLHKAVGDKITIDKPPHKSYPGSGAEGLINGISGSNSRFGDKEWLGFWGDDIEITIDFDQPKIVNSISTRFHNGNGQWIYAPKEVTIQYLLQDEMMFVTDKHDIKASKNSIVNFQSKMTKVEDRNMKVKSIIIKVPNYGTIAEGKQGAGNKAWTFIDEIIVN